MVLVKSVLLKAQGTLKADLFIKKGEGEVKGARKKIIPIVYIGTVDSERIAYSVMAIRRAGCDGVFLAGENQCHSQSKADIYQVLRKQHPGFFIGLSFSQKVMRTKVVFEQHTSCLDGILLREMSGYEDGFMDTKILRDVYCNKHCLLLGCIPMADQIAMGEKMLRKTILSASQVVNIICCNSMIIEASKLSAALDTSNIQLGILIDRLDESIPAEYIFAKYFLPVLPFNEVPSLGFKLQTLCRNIREY